jgi:ATP-dependent helicase HrpA
VARLLSQAQELRRRLTPLALRTAGLPAGSPVAVAVADIEGQLGALVGPRFVRLAGAARLGDMERYLTAIERRLDKLPAAPARDLAATRRLQALQQQLAEARASLARTAASPAAAHALEDARWMLEELRVSLFAQSLGTKGPVSEERARRFIGTAIGLAPAPGA